MKRDIFNETLMAVFMTFSSYERSQNIKMPTFLVKDTQMLFSREVVCLILLTFLSKECLLLLTKIEEPLPCWNGSVCFTAAVHAVGGAGYFEAACYVKLKFLVFS